MGRHILGREQAIELLREWSREKGDLALHIEIASKFRLLFTDGDLREEEGAIFSYSTSNIENFILHQFFERIEREETEECESLIFSDLHRGNIMQIMRSKGDEPLSRGDLSKLVN